MKRKLMAAFALLSTGCSSALPTFHLDHGQEAKSHTLVERLAIEAQGLSDMFRLRALIELAIVVTVALLLVRAASVVLKVAWRLGFDARRRLGGIENASRVVLAAVVLYLIARRVAAAAPIVSAFAFVVLLASASWVFSGHIQNALVGVGLVLRRRIRGGDRIQVGGHGGIVQRVGIAQVELRQPDGATSFVPNRLLNDAVVTVARVKNTVPVRVRLRLAGAVTGDVLEDARRVAVLSPYRAPGSMVEVTGEEDDHAVAVQIQVWSEAAGREARAQLESSLRAALADKSEARKAVA